MQNLPKIALEVPKSNLSWSIQFCDYFFVLSHLMHDWEYRNFVYQCMDKNIELYLDNSAYELRESINLDSYIGLIIELQPSVVVVPDALNDLGKTIRLTRRFYEGLPAKYFDRGKYNIKFMIVLQGQDNRERMKCFHIIRSFGYPFDIIGLPRVACPNRVELLKAVKRFVRRKEVHLLGLPDPRELKGLAGLVSSLDTSWVSKYSIGKGPHDYLDFEKDKIDERKFIEGLQILKESF